MTTMPDITTDSDRWGRLTGSEFARREPWLAAAAEAMAMDRALYRTALVEALAAAADEQGQLLDFRINRWYERHVSDAMRDEDDPAGWGLKYDRFTAMVLTAELYQLMMTGWLAQRGNGDSYDYRLALPPA